MSKESKFSLALAKLDYNNPAKIFSKSVCRIEKDKKEVVSAKKVFPGDSIKIYFSDGVLKATVTEKEEGKSLVLEVKVADSDMGKVIGKQGRIAKAIRSVVKAASSKDNTRVDVEIV